MPPEKLRIGLLVCDETKDDDRTLFGSYDDMLRRSLLAASGEIDITSFLCHTDMFPQNPWEFDGYLISGSKASVYEDTPWVKELLGFIRQCDGHRAPCVGLCFGHQAIALAMGGAVEPAENGWGFGIQRMQVENATAWIKEADSTAGSPSCDLIVIHRDQVTRPPDGYRTIGSNDFCPYSMIESPDRMLGIQGHPEVTKTFCRHRLELRKPDLGEAVYQAGLDSLDSMDTESLRVMKWIVRFFERSIAKAKAG